MEGTYKAAIDPVPEASEIGMDPGVQAVPDCSTAGRWYEWGQPVCPPISSSLYCFPLIPSLFRRVTGTGQSIAHYLSRASSAQHPPLVRPGLRVLSILYKSSEPFVEMLLTADYAAKVSELTTDPLSASVVQRPRKAMVIRRRRGHESKRTTGRVRDL